MPSTGRRYLTRSPSAPPTMPGHRSSARSSSSPSGTTRSYNCFSSGHKFCREVCPVVQVTRNESWSPTAFHANVVAMERGHLDIADMAADYVNCTQCGACELRCPNTLFTGDFYRFRTRTVDVVKAVRALAVDSGVHQPAWQRWNASDRCSARTSRCSAIRRSARITSATGPTGSTSRSAASRSCSSTARPRSTAPSVPRAVAQILQLAGYEFGLMAEQWCCGGPAAEMGYVDQARRFAEHNLADWRAAGARRVLVLDPHDYITFTEDYPRYFGDDFDIEVVLVVELFAEMIRDGRLRAERADRSDGHVPRPVPAEQAQGDLGGASRDPAGHPRACRSRDVDRVTQWSYCSGAGGGLADREARAHRADQRPAYRAGRRARRRHAGERLPVVGAPA